MSLETRAVPLSQTTTAIPPFPHDTCRTDAQCLNGGTCTVFKPGQLKSGTDDEYNYCSCQDGYGGQRCESHCPLTCQNGGVCHPKSALYGSVNIDDPNPFFCQCLGHYTGTECDVPYENCADGSQCFYGGVCLERDDIIPVNYCDCPSTREGSGCENDALGIQIDQEHRASAKISLTIKYISLGIVVGITVFFGVGLVMMRRRRRRNERRYHAIQASDDYQNGIETRDLKRKQEKWRNVV